MRVFYVTCATSWRNPGDKAKGWPDGAHVAGFYDAWHEGVANTIVHFARTLKAISPDRLVGAFYGALGGDGLLCPGHGDRDCEDDSRTHLSKPWMQRDAMALYTAAESVETLSGVCVCWRILI